MAELKTQPNEASVAALLDGVSDQTKRQDCYALVELMRQVTGALRIAGMVNGWRCGVAAKLASHP